METIEQVIRELAAINKGIDVEMAITADELRRMKPHERHLRAARLIDLYERRIWVFNDALGRMAEFVLPAMYELVATAFSTAIEKDRGSVIFWRKEASAR